MEAEIPARRSQAGRSPVSTCQERSSLAYQRRWTLTRAPATGRPSRSRMRPSIGGPSATSRIFTSPVAAGPMTQAAQPGPKPGAVAAIQGIASRPSIRAPRLRPAREIRDEPAVGAAGRVGDGRVLRPEPGLPYRGPRDGLSLRIDHPAADLDERRGRGGRRRGVADGRGPFHLGAGLGERRGADTGEGTPDRHAPAAMSPSETSVSEAVAAIFSRDTSRPLMIRADRAEAEIDAAPPVAAATADRARAAGTDALAPAAEAVRTAPSDPAVTPRRVSRSRSRRRALTSRCRSVGSVQRRRSAACS